MKILKELCSVIWNVSLTLVIVTSGLYIVMKIITEMEISKLAAQCLIWAYMIVILGMIYKINLHDVIKDMYEKRKNKNIK